MSDTASWTERVKKIWKESWIKRAKESWVTPWLALLATVVGIVFQVYLATQEERQIWYWTILTTPAPGNSGKKEALEHLASHGTPLPSIDLSCHAMGGEETVTNSDGSKTTKCERPVYLEDLDLSKKTLGEEANLIRANLSGANLSGANLFSVNLSGANLLDAKLFSAKLFSANLSGANLFSANLSDADLINANLSGANLSGANLFSVNLSDADLSDADFDDATFSSDTTFTNAWAWADKPPRNLPATATIQIQLCKYNNTEGSDRNRRPDPCIPPDTK